MDDERLGDYELEERVARGGMGEVWRARAVSGERKGQVVCIKRLDNSLRGDVDFIEMFRDEAMLVLDLDHDNIVKMHELIDTEDELAQVMEYVDGPSLARIRSAMTDLGTNLSVGEALQIAVYLCRALHHAHTRTRDGVVGGAPLAIVHRDVSPQNILIDKSGKLKLVDFGIAKAAQRLTRTQAGTLKGKLSYMAPEQARGDPLDHRADQFAAGILVWEMLTGRRLFGGRNELLILDQVQKSDPVPPSTVKKGVPRSVDRAVLRALRWHRAERWPDMAAFERALQVCLQEIEPRTGRVDLAPLVARTLAHVAENTHQRIQQEGAPRTRVISAESGNDASSSSPSSGSATGPSSINTASAPTIIRVPSGGDGTRSTSDPKSNFAARATFGPAAATSLPPTDTSQQPEHTGQFFQRRSWRNAAIGVAATGAGAVIVAGIIGAAVWLSERGPVEEKPVSAAPPFVDVASARTTLATYAAPLKECGDPCIERVLTEIVEEKPEKLDTVDALRLDRCLARCSFAGAGAFAPPSPAVLEEKLNASAAHPCRTELLDDLLDKSPLSDEARAALADDVDVCLLYATEAPKLRNTAKLDAPPWPKKKKRTRAVVLARVVELERRGRTALAAGEYERAKELLVEALALEPERVDDHALVGQAFRGLGDPAGAAHHLRLWLHARPRDVDAERAARYLRRYRQAETFKPSADPSPEERHVRVARLVDDASAAMKSDDGAAAVKHLEQARALLPQDSKILIALGDAYLAAQRTDDAKRTFEEALVKTSGAAAKNVKEKLAKIGGA